MNRWPVILTILVTVFIVGVIAVRVWVYGEEGLDRPDGDLSDPNDLTLTKLRLDEPVRPDPRDERLPL